jgi:hypothetical protein
MLTILLQKSKICISSMIDRAVTVSSLISLGNKIYPCFFVLECQLEGEKSYVIGKGYVLNVINDRNSSQTLHLIVSDGQVSDFTHFLAFYDCSI